MALTEHLEKLRHFHKIASFQSINAAARSSGVSQAGLSKSLSQLEAVLGAELFSRSHDGLLLTPAGELTLKTTKLILDESDALEAKLASLQKSSKPQTLRIGMYDSIAVYLLPKFQRHFSKYFAELEIELTIDRSTALANHMAHGRLDFAIGVNFHRSSIVESTYFELYKDSYSFYSSSALTQSPKNRLIFHPEATDQNGATCEDFLKKVSRERLRYRVYNFESIKTLTDLGFGIGVLPIQVAKPLIEQNRFKQVGLPKLPRIFGTHTIGLAASNSFYASSSVIVEDIIKIVSQWSKK